MLTLKEAEIRNGDWTNPDDGKVLLADYAATWCATLRELMDRMGHHSQRAAMVYFHGSDERQHQIADTLSKLARDELK